MQTNNCRLFFLLSILLLTCYSNSFYASWQLDDKPNILNNQRLQLNSLAPQQIKQTFFAKPGSGSLYRPAACLTLGLNWYFGQDNVAGYHWVNFLIHLATAWLLFLTIKKLFSTPRLHKKYSNNAISWIAISATLFWALNPVQTQAVTYIVQRMASLAGFFSIVAIYYYLSSRLADTVNRRTTCLTAASVSYILAILSKENAGTIILCIPIIELLFFHITLSRKILRKVFTGSLLAIVICILGGFALRPELFDFILNYYVNRPFTLTERLLTEQRIIIDYLSLLFYPNPNRLSIENDTILSTALFTPWTTLPAILFNALLVFLAIKVGQKQPFISLAILFYYINHLIESTIVPLELYFEHRNYLPSLFLFIPLAQFLHFLMVKYNKNKTFTLAIIGAAILIWTAEGYATYERNKIWKTVDSLWLDALLKAPNSARPLAVLGLKLGFGPNPTEEKYRKALALTERSLSMRMARKRLDAAQIGNMASIYNRLGEFQTAIEHYDHALSIAPEDASIRFNLSKVLINTGNFLRAEEEIINLLNQGYVHADYFNLLGFIRLQAGFTQQALPPLQEAFRIAPNRPDILLTIGKCFSLLGYHRRANWFFSRKRKLGGNDAVVSLCIIENFLLENNLLLAKKELRQALNSFPLSYYVAPLHAEKNIQYRTVPLSKEMLLPFIRSELPTITSPLLQ